MTKREVFLEGGAPWGFRMNGGADAGHPLRISRVNPGSKAAQQGVREGDVISAINGTPTRLLSNGESHALLRSAGPTLTLGLNQDCTGSPKRRSRDAAKRSESGSGNQETKSQNDSVTQAQIKTVADTTACTSTSQLNKQGKKAKQRRQENIGDGTVNFKKSNSGDDFNSVTSKEEFETAIEIQTSQKMSSSKARRLRKARLKSKMKEDGIDDFIDVAGTSDNSKNLPLKSAVDIVNSTAITSPKNTVLRETEKILSSGCIESSQLSNTSDNVKVIEGLENTSLNNSKKKKEKRKDKSETKRSFEVESSTCGNVYDIDSSKKSKTTQKKQNIAMPDDGIESLTNESSSVGSRNVVTKETTSHSVTITEVECNLSEARSQNKNINDQTQDVSRCTKEIVKIIDSSLINKNSNLRMNKNCSEDFVVPSSERLILGKNASYEKDPLEHVGDITSVCKKEIVKIVDSSDVENKKSFNKNGNVENYGSCEKEDFRVGNTFNSETKVQSVKCNEKVDLPLSIKEPVNVVLESKVNESRIFEKENSVELCDKNTELISNFENKTDTDALLNSHLLKNDAHDQHNNDPDSDPPHFEVFINPPTPTMGVENSIFGPDWENVEEIETSSGPVSSDEDLHQEYIVHFPPNDLRAQVSSPASIEDGVDEYGLTVQDIRNPLIPPEEEERLRCFLETLELTKPEEYDDSSSNKSSEDALTGSESDCCAAKQEVVVYKHCKKRCVAEPCYIPSSHRNYLDVITEENSDVSDSDRKSEERPWENPEIIRINNDIDSIPDDWIDSDNEVESGCDDGGIKSWSEGTTLDEAEGVEIIYLDSDTSDDTAFKEPDFIEKPQLVLVQTKEINTVISIEKSENNNPVCSKRNSIEIENPKHGSLLEESMNDAGILKCTSQNKESKIMESGSESTCNARYTVNSVDSACNIIGDNDDNNNNNNSNCDKRFNNSNNDGVKLNNSTKYETKSSNAISNLDSLDLIKSSSHCTHINFENEIKEVTEFETLFKSLTSKNYSEKPNLFDKSSLNEKNKENSSVLCDENFPVPQEKLDVSATPALSRQNSSDSGTPTTQSTTRCTTSQSPVFSETEGKIGNRHVHNIYRGVQFNPESLKELSAKRVISLPNGIRLLEEVGIIRFKSESLDYDKNQVRYEGRGVSPRNISGRSSFLPESPLETRPTSRPLSLGSSSLPNDMFSPRSSSVLMFTPPSSNINSPPYSIPLDNDEQWISMQTSEENLRVCLSPSQFKSSTLPTSPKEAAGLLDLHKKFVQRRGYHEDKRSYSNDNYPSPDLIQLENCNEMRKPQDYTPELLTEAANLLALKEYRQSRFTEDKSKHGSVEKFKDTFNQTIEELSAINETKNKEITKDNVRLYGSEVKNNKTKKDVYRSTESITEKESKRKGRVFDSDFTYKIPASSEIFSDSKGGELEVEESSKRGELGRVLEPSDGSRLLALIQSQIYPAAKAHCPIATTALCNPPFDRTGEETGKKCTGSDDYVSGWLTMSRNVNQSESKRVFDADQYRISKQGDIAVMLSPDAKRPERPKSLPSSVSSDGEIFRRKMYDEYMDKVAERYERRQQKVIKLSDRPASMFVSKDELKDVTIPSEVPKLEDEFMCKVKQRMSKLGISLEDDDTNDIAIEDSQLPKHLQEFVQLTAESPQNGVWSPAQTPEAQRKKFDFASAQEEREKERQEEEKKKEEVGETPVVWTPRTAPSPPVEKKTFRPINFESPPPVRKVYQSANEKTGIELLRKKEPVKPPNSLPLTPSEWSQKDKVDKALVSESIETHRRLTSSQSAESSLAASTENTLPRAPNPTITLLQKAREGQLPRGAHYLDEEENTRIEKPEEIRLVEPNEIRYTVQREYCTETEDKKPKKFVDLGPRKFEGIGPTTKDGIPIVLRSEVKDANQQKWYKRMYDSLHRAEKDRETVTVRYKPRKGYPYSSVGGYLSEPDRLGTDYDSDAATSKYATLDRRRIRNKENDFTTSTMPRSKYVSNSVKNAVDVYKNQPGRIEDYVPGRSSISEKEAKQWWDEVLDIFDEQFEQSQKSSRPPPTTPNSGKPFMTYALKESGYESDSQLVFKRRDENLQNQLAMSPAEQKMAYKVIQKGGEVPLHGLRKLAPERPKEPISGGAIPVPERDFHSKQQRPESPHRYVESEVTIHYRSPVRSEAKEAWSEEELARRQAEAMRRIYQEERRRKYLQELQDMYSRRHTDNFIPSQKSPIPLNRYDDFLDDVSPTKPRDHTPEPKLVARALYNFVGQSSRELTFRRGDVIFVRRQIDKNWYEGEHNAMIGLFPINYVEIIPYDGIRTTPKRPSEGQARAKFNFQAQTHLELSLVKGELVVLTRRVDDNWFEGRIGSRKGIFPVSYVDILVEPGDRTVSPVRPTTPASNKPVASPAAHSLMLNGAKNSLSHHHYTPPPPVSYTSLTRSTKSIKSDLAPVNQALHIDTQSEPVPYRALYNYKPQNDDELELNEGDTVYVMEKCDDGWYVGSSQRTGCFGTFPGNYVQRLSRGH